MFCTAEERMTDWTIKEYRVTETRRGGIRGRMTMMWTVKISHRTFLFLLVSLWPVSSL